MQATMKPTDQLPMLTLSTRASPRSGLLLVLAPALLALVLALPACKRSDAGDAKSEQTASKSDAKCDKDGNDGADCRKEDTAVPVEIAKAARRPIAASYSGTASLDAPGEAQVVSKASGIVLAILTEEGQRVRKGQVLARLDNEHQRLQVAQAAATVRKLESNYARSQKMVAAKLVSTEANDQIACIVMIETAQGLANLDEIVATPGLSGVYIGPSDLALALGLSARGDTDDPRHMAAVERIRDACKARGVPVGIHTGGLDYTKRRLAQGFDFVTLGGDAVLLMQAVTRDLAAARAAAAEKAPASA